MEVSEVEKLISGLGALAEALAIYRDGLLKLGFERQEALHLCALLQDHLIKDKKGGTADD